MEASMWHGSTWRVQPGHLLSEHAAVRLNRLVRKLAARKLAGAVQPSKQISHSSLWLNLLN